MPSFIWKIFISVQKKFLYALQSQGYDAIYRAKATGNHNKTEDEAEASTADIAKLI